MRREEGGEEGPCSVAAVQLCVAVCRVCRGGGSLHVCHTRYTPPSAPPFCSTASCDRVGGPW